MEVLSILNWLQTNWPIVSLITTIILVIITGVYVFLTKKILDLTVRQVVLAPNPVVGIHLRGMEIGKVFGPSRRLMNIGLTLVNVGNAPAIEVLIDAEIILRYSSIRGEKAIPSRFEPFSIAFIRPGEEIEGNPYIYPEFGNTCVTHLLDDFREESRLNIHRIETDPSQEPYTASMLKIYVYYRNNLGQYFESTVEAHLDLEEIPGDNETAELSIHYLPRPKFCAYPTSKEEIDKSISSRNNKRNLCG